MRILIYSSAYFSDNTLPLYKAMKEKGWDVTLLFELTRPNSCLFEDKELIEKKGIFKAVEYKSIQQYENYCDLNDVYVNNNPYSKAFSLQELSAVLRVKNFIKQGRFDYIHTDLYYITWNGLLLKFRKKIVNIIHEPFIREGGNVKYINWLRKISFKFIPKIVLLNDSDKEKFCRKFNINPQKVFVNKLGPFDCIKAIKIEDRVENSKKILFWGRIATYKGVDLLCQAMLKVHESVPDVKLVIAGGGSFYFDITPYQELSFIEIHNLFLRMKDIASFITNCDFVVCPYYSVTQSGPVITSLTMDKPVVASDLEGMREVIDNGVTGLLFPTGDVNALSNTIIRLFEEPNLLDKLQKNIKKNNESDHTWSDVADKYLGIYKTNN